MFYGQKLLVHDSMELKCNLARAKSGKIVSKTRHSSSTASPYVMGLRAARVALNEHDHLPRRGDQLHTLALQMAQFFPNAEARREAEEEARKAEIAKFQLEFDMQNQDADNQADNEADNHDAPEVDMQADDAPEVGVNDGDMQVVRGN